MNIRNLDTVSSYLSLKKIAFVGFVGICSMRAPGADSLSVTLGSMLLLYLLCCAQQFRDRKNVERVCSYLSKHLGVDQNGTARLMDLSKELVTLAVNSKHYSGIVHAGMQEVLNAVSKEKNNNKTLCADNRKIDYMDVAEKTFKVWRKKIQADAENEAPTSTKGN